MYEFKIVWVYKMFFFYIVFELFYVGIGEIMMKKIKEFYIFYYIDLMQNKKIKLEIMCFCIFDICEIIFYLERVLIGYGFVDN